MLSRSLKYIVEGALEKVAGGRAGITSEWKEAVTAFFTSEEVSRVVPHLRGTILVLNGQRLQRNTKHSARHASCLSRRSRAVLYIKYAIQPIIKAGTSKAVWRYTDGATFLFQCLNANAARFII